MSSAHQEQKEKIKKFEAWYEKHIPKNLESMTERAAFGYACAQEQKRLGYATQSGAFRKNMVRALEITPQVNTIEEFTRYYLHGGKKRY